MKDLQKMNEALQERLSSLKPFIKSIDGNTEDFIGGEIHRIRFELINGYSISLIKGHGVYSGKNDATFEMAVIDPSGSLDYTLTDGDVLGYQTVDDFVQMVHKVIEHYK